MLFYKKIMNSNRLEEILNSFSSERISKLGEFLNSSYLNANKKLIPFHDYLIKNENYKKNELDRFEVFNEVYAFELFNEDKYFRLRSDMLAAVKNFLVIEKVNKPDVYYKKTLLELFSESDLKNNFQKTFKELGEFIKAKNKSSQDYLYSIEILSEELTCDHHTKETGDIHKLDSALNYFFFSLKLNLLNSSGAIKHKDVLFAKNILNYFSSNKKKLSREELYLYSQYLLLKLKAGESAKDYTEFKSFLSVNSAVLNAEQKSICYNELIKYLISNNKIAEAFKNIKKIEKEKFLVLSSKMDLSTFIQYFEIGLAMDDTVWVENFVNEYSPYIEDNYKNDALNLSLAKLNYYKRRLKPALENISQIHSVEYYFQLNKRIYNIIINSELGKYDHIKYPIDASVKYLKYHKQEGYKQYIEFLVLLQKIIKFKRGMKHYTKASLLKSIQTGDAFNKEWLIKILKINSDTI